jgi:hypothetical protein
MVALEKRFVDLAFGLARIDGMDAAGIKSYAHYIADWRLTQLKPPPVFSYFAETESGHRQVMPHPLPQARRDPERRRARQFLRAARDRIFQGCKPR